MTTAIDAVSTPASSAAAAGATLGEQPRRRRGRGRQHDGVGLDQLRRRGGTDHDTEAALAPDQLAHRGPRANVDPCGQRVGQAGHPAGQPGEHRLVGRRQRDAEQGAPLRAAAPAGARSRGRTAAARGRRTPRRGAARPAGRPPRRPAGCATRSPTETSSPTADPGLLVCDPGMPSADSTPERRSSSRSSGTPISERGSGRSSPRVQIRDEASPGARRRARAHGPASTPSGRRLSIASAPTSTTTPPTSARRSFPPVSGDGLEHGDVVAALCQEVGRRQPRDPAPDHHDPHAVQPPRRPGGRPRTAPTGCWSGRCEEL